MVERLGVRYDMKNIFDMLALLLSDTACAGPVAAADARVRIGRSDACDLLVDDRPGLSVGHYPILPEITRAPGRQRAVSDYSRREILHIRHHSLFAPRDFDLSPYFQGDQANA
jgi:hypothetical protein